MEIGKATKAIFILLTILHLSGISFAGPTFDVTYNVTCSNYQWVPTNGACSNCIGCERISGGNKVLLNCSYIDTLVPPGSTITSLKVSSFIKRICNTSSSSLVYKWVGGPNIGGQTIGTYTSSSCGCMAPFPVTYSVSDPASIYTIGGENSITLNNTGTAATSYAGIVGGAPVGFLPNNYLQVNLTYTIPNTAPSATVTISPVAPYPGSVVTCEARVIDAEDMILRYSATLWINNAAFFTQGGTVTNNSAQIVLTSTPLLYVGDILKCSLEYDDLILSGPTAYSDNVTVISGAIPGVCGVPNSGLGECIGGMPAVHRESDCNKLTQAGPDCCAATELKCKWDSAASKCVYKENTGQSTDCSVFDNNSVACHLFSDFCSWQPHICGAPYLGPNNEPNYVGRCTPGGLRPTDCGDVHSGEWCCKATTNCIWDGNSCIRNESGYPNGVIPPYISCRQFDNNWVGCDEFKYKNE